MIIAAEPRHIPTLTALFNRAAEEDVPFKAMDEARFAGFFTRSSEAVDKILLVLTEGEEIQGFASGCVPAGKDTGYVSFVYVLPGLRGQGKGRALVLALEKAMQTAHPQVVKFDMVFHNPMQFPWWIPGSGQKHDHPCAPAVDMSSPAFIFFKRVGYRSFTYMNSYYQRLDNYRFPADIQDKIARLKENNIEVTYYDRTRHDGLNDLFTNIKNEGWRQAIMANDALGDQALPLLVAVADGHFVCGYTGPLKVEPSGRGYFHGIGVHTEYRQNGAGKVLFANLCMALKDMGATFMSLYTGEDNPARNIYEAVGFNIVKSWAGMRKQPR